MNIYLRALSRLTLIVFLPIIFCASVSAHAAQYVPLNSDNRISSESVTVTISSGLTTVTDIDVDSLSLYRISTEQQAFLISGPVSKETSQYQEMNTSATIDYSIHDRLTVSGAITNYSNRQTSTASDGMVTKDNGTSRIGMGVSFELSQCHCSMSMDIPLSELVSVNGKPIKLSAKTMTLTGQWNIPSDPLVFSLQGSVTLRKPFDVDDIAVDFGDTKSLSSAINFSVNDQVTLSGGINISHYGAQVIDQTTSASNIGLSTNFGVGYMFNSSLSLLVSYSQARDNMTENFALAIAFSH